MCKPGISHKGNLVLGPILAYEIYLVVESQIVFLYNRFIDIGKLRALS